MEHSSGGQDFSEDMFTTSLLQYVFDGRESSSPLEGASNFPSSGKPLNLENIDAHIDSCVDEVTTNELKLGFNSKEWETGRLGAVDCFFDVFTVGSLIVDIDKLGVTSHSNFSSIKANCCVYEGKWMYELMLSSKGVMQVGWCTSNCRFSQEEGVGDTRDSYAYDGSRLRKWNVSTKKYGEPWMADDVISCAIDCDDGTITFYRNGVCLGEAFNQVRIGPGYAYFPAVSLSLGESLHANFGALPIRYPIEGYKPIQSPKAVEVARAELLLTYMHKLLPRIVEDEQRQAIETATVAKPGFPYCTSREQRSRTTTLVLAASHIMHKLAPLLRIPYVVDLCLLKFMLGLCDHIHWKGNQMFINKLLDLMWMLLQPQEIQDSLEHLIVSMVNGYRFNPFHTEFEYARLHLALMIALMKHQRTRRHLLSSVLFDRVKFPVFMHIKAPDDTNLARMIPTVWWDNRTQEEIENGEELLLSKEEEECKSKYDTSSFNLCEKVEDVETMQIELLKCLLINNDTSEGKSTREQFLEKLKLFLKENSGLSRAPLMYSCSLRVSLSFFHRLVQAARCYWDSCAYYDSSCLGSKDAYIPIYYFWRDSREYMELLRCGGLMSHLNRQLISEVNRVQSVELQDDGKVVKKSAKETGEKGKSHEEYPPLEMPSGSSLLDLLDSVVYLYHIAAHKQLGKRWALRDNMQDFISNLQDTENKLRKCPEGLDEVKDHLENAKKVFEEKIIEQARQMVWVSSIIYSPSKQEDIAWLLKVALTTIEKASQYKKLFLYVPEFYIETIVNSFNALRNYIHPTTPFTSIRDLGPLMTRYATFLVDHFFDQRLVSNDLKDTLVQALACFTCYPDTLKVLEELPIDKRSAMIEALISPYENRSWAHTNWILVRIWKGCGFGYRYHYLPNLIPHKAQPTEFSFVSLQKPCPSQEFQSLLAKILLDEEGKSSRFLDTLLNQLNWSFTEFVGIIQEISAQTSRAESPVVLESRQIKICAACFEISVCLLRVLEMVATVAPQVFTDWSRPSAEVFLKRLMQLLSQIMARITLKDGAFENTVSYTIRGLDCVTLYPILTVTVGIMAQLIIRCGGTSQKKATRALLLDTGFSTSSLEFVLGGPEEDGQQNEKNFSFRKYDEISKEELEDTEKLFHYLCQQQILLSSSEESVKEEDLCTICYANSQQIEFVPCGHRSCRTCITQQILSKKECFFCIAAITNLKDLKGKQVMREHFQAENLRKS